MTKHTEITNPEDDELLSMTMDDLTPVKDLKELVGRTARIEIKKHGVTVDVVYATEPPKWATQGAGYEILVYNKDGTTKRSRTNNATSLSRVRGNHMRVRK